MRKLTDPAALPPAPRSGQGGRWLLHLSLGTLFACAGAVALVWPQWISEEGSRSSLEIQRERERGLEERLETVRAMNGRLPRGTREGRKLFQPEQAAQLPHLVREAARREKVTVIEARLTSEPAPRWKPVRIETAEAGALEPAAEVRPARMKIVLTGTFEGVFRTVGTLCQQEQIFLPERWNLAPVEGLGKDGRQVKAQIAATVFVLRKSAEAPLVPPVAQVALALPLAGDGSKE